MEKSKIVNEVDYRLKVLRLEQEMQLLKQEHLVIRKALKDSGIQVAPQNQLGVNTGTASLN